MFLTVWTYPLKETCFFPEKKKIFHVFNVNSSVSWYNSYFISLLSYSISWLFFEQDFERKGWHVGGYPYIPMIQYKRHKNRFFQNKVNIVWLWPLPLSMPVKDFFIYIYFFWRGGIWNLTFTSHCLLEVGWTWTMYVCLYTANFREPVCLGHPHLVQPQIVSETGWFCGFWNRLNTHELRSWAIRFSHSGWFLYRSRQQRDLRHVVSCVYWMIVSFTEMISNQFDFGSLSRDLQSFIRPKWFIFSSIKCMIGCPLKGLGYLFRFQPHRKRWKRWQKFHNMGPRWLPPWGWQNCWTFWYFFGFGHGTETLAKLIGMFGGSFQLISD